MSKYDTWLDGLEKTINKPKIQEPRPDPKQIKESINEGILDARAHKIQRLVEDGELELISKEFVKTLCQFSFDIVAFLDKETFQQIIQEINDNKKRIREMKEGQGTIPVASAG